MATLVQINKKAQAIRRLHPKMKWNDAQKKAAKELKGSRVGAVKKRAPVKRKKAVTVTKVTVSGVKKKSTGVSYSQASILSSIDRLEKKLAKTAPKNEKNLLIRLINADHAKLEAVKRYAKTKLK